MMIPDRKEQDLIRIVTLENLLKRRRDEIRLWKEAAQTAREALESTDKELTEKALLMINDLLTRVSVA